MLFVLIHYTEKMEYSNYFVIVKSLFLFVLVIVFINLYLTWTDGQMDGRMRGR